ncbi:XrtA/PEP-CTERM system amidotransferase [Sedimenticola selenatireducens]|uniref:asparagine synthase (glutamine-hydrolyzing) n=1 Tax=Sedimenticola selenatireducens TaxID=191960 RepID=A0A557S845_9GAMM|nr:XrtA/PEP-CTERM system amidotransferase [Sedimenticola selenatireducens]TVO73575.1 amidotransferase 1, exosortase A system-associated [Sedimenticola selenatireducens]TVT63515.1 MAG: amidotransferase 1, exosortase A system-associated [Sedimenticola selenatireducens]
MCGIVGIFDTTGVREIDRDLLSRMNETQFHRGPDEGGLHTEPGLGFGHRRLSIIDLASGQQPLFNEDHTVVVTYNGEIYNFPQLSDELKALGHQFRTHSDTEVIVHAWEEWGESCVERFRGMFAFAVWDRNRGTLFLARDRLGIKPLFYALLPDGRFIFGSELKSLRVHDTLPTTIDPAAVEEYFTFGYIPEPRTIFKQVYKLSPGFSLTLKRGAGLPEPKQYWDVAFKSHGLLSESSAGDELIARLEEAVKIRMMAEVPLGAFLSGGVDSSAIVGLMAGLSDQPVNTCSISFGDPKFNESQYAALVAKKFKTAHRVEQVDPDDFDLIDHLADLYDEPYADSSALPTFRVCELAKKEVTVVLSGDGGDENMAGYRRYRWHTYEERMRNLLPASLRQPLFGLLGKAYPKADWAPRVFRAKSTFESMARDTLQGYMHSVSILSNQMRSQLFSDSLKKDLQGYHAIEVFKRHAKQSPTDHPLSLVQYLDLKTYLVGDILTKVDRASMAHALEVRVPILDHHLVDWMSGLSPDMKLRGTEGKYLFKKALEPMLPHEILYRKKMGFAVPLASWFRGPLKEKVRNNLLSREMLDSGLFNQRYLETLVNHHQSGVRDYSASIWTLLMFHSFLKKMSA